MSQTSNPLPGDRDDSKSASSYEDLKQAMMQQNDTAADSPVVETTVSTDGRPSQVQSPRPDSTPQPNPEQSQSLTTLTENEESVEDYMNRLLKRSSSSARNPESNTVAQKAAATNVTGGVTNLLEETFAEDLKKREKELRPVTLNKATLPELEASFLSEMRSVSRQSADFAINDCQKRRYSSSASIQLGIGATLVGFGLLQTFVAPTALNTASIALPCYAIAVCFFWRYTQWRNLTRNLGKERSVPAS